MGAMIEFDLLERRAHAFESGAEAEASAPLPGEPVPIDPAEELADLLKYVRDAASLLWPYLPGVYTDEAVEAIAAKGVPLMKKHGVTLGGLSGRFAEEIAFGAVVVPLALAHWHVHKAWKAEQDKARTIDADGNVTNERPAPTPERAPVVVDHGGRLGEM